MINRRDFLGITVGAGATLTLTPQLLRALQQQAGKLMQRAIPSSGEMLPVISFAPRSLGGAAMSSQPLDVAAIKAVLRTFLDNGGKVVDVMHGGPAGEQGARTAAAEATRELREERREESREDRREVRREGAWNSV